MIDPSTMDGLDAEEKIIAEGMLKVALGKKFDRRWLWGLGDLKTESAYQFLWDLYEKEKVDYSKVRYAYTLLLMNEDAPVLEYLQGILNTKETIETRMKVLSALYWLYDKKFDDNERHHLFLTILFDAMINKTKDIRLYAYDILKDHYGMTDFTPLHDSVIDILRKRKKDEYQRSAKLFKERIESIEVSEVSSRMIAKWIKALPDNPPIMKMSDCEICSQTPDNVSADMTDGESLDEYTSKLETVLRFAYYRNSVMRYPICGMLYRYKYEYEYLVHRSEEDESLWRSDSNVWYVFEAGLLIANQDDKSMEEITIKYWSPHGRQEETKFQSGHSKIDLVMRAAIRVDLSGISKCSKLKKLDLSHNMLEELDLSPISGCDSIQEINLQSNHLTKLDLWPLKKCIELRNLDVSENRLHGLDLTPVFLETHVKMDSSVVVSADNILRYVFTKEVLTKQFQLFRPDGASWTVPPVVMWNMYNEMTEQFGWSELKERIDCVLQRMSKDQWYGAQRGLLHGFGIPEIAGIDTDPRMLLELTDERMSFEEARQAIFDRSVQILEWQLNDGGPTLFLDIERMRKTSASKLIPQIVTQRKHELENSIILIKGSTVFLRPLWLTHYGYKILLATGMGLTTDLEGLDSLRKSFDELDLELATQKVTVAKDMYEGKASRGMQRHVFDLIRGAYD